MGRNLTRTRRRQRRKALGVQLLEQRMLLTVSGEITTDTTWTEDTVISGTLTIRSSATVTVDSGVRVTIEEGADLFVEGTFDVGANGTVRIDDGSGSFLGSDNRIEVRSGGAILATDSVFDRNGDGTDRVQLIVESGGEFSFTNSSFDLDNMVLADGSIIGSSGVNGNEFDTPIFTPLAHLFPGNSNLLNNARFQDVEILSGQTIGNGESLTLSPLGTVTTTNMNYRLNDLTVAAGGSLELGPGSRTFAEENLTLSIGGAMHVNQAEFFSMVDGDDNNGSANLIEVVDGGSLRFTDTVFDRAFSGDQRDFTQFAVRSGGQLEASNTTFDVERILFEDGSLIGANGISGNQFDSPIFTPLAHLFPGNPNLLNNERFLDVEILAGQTINNGESLTLLPMGTVTTTNMNYRMNDLTIAAGGSLELGPDSRTFAEENLTLSIGGAMHVNQAEFFSMVDGDDNNGSANLIEVVDGGSLRFTDTVFDRAFSGDQRDFTQFAVRSGGQLEASNTTFDVEQILFEDASVIGALGVTGNRFDSPIFTPLAHLFPGNPNLLNNERFLDVEILGGQTINNGESLTLLPMGTVTTTNMNYRMNDLTIAAGGSLELGPDSRTFAEENLTLSIGGAMHVNQAEFFSMVDGDDNNGSANLIEVVDGGSLRFTDTVFDRAFSGDQRDFTQFAVRSGGQLEASNTTFDVEQILFEDASVIGALGVTGNRFDSPVFTPLAHLFPGNPNLLNNERFLDVEILGGQTINNGESLTLLPMGTVTTTNMNFRLNDLTVAAGGSLELGPDSRTFAEENLTLSIGGSMHVNQAEFFSMVDGDDNNGSANLIEVVDGGSLRFTDTVFDRAFSGDQRDFTQFAVRSGGQLEASNTTFDVEQILFEDASVIGALGVTGNRFDSPVFTPLAHLFPGNPNLSNNERFLDVEILGGQTINNGESLTLLPMGTVTTTNMNYRMNDLTVAAGGSLELGPDSRTFAEENLTLSIGGAMHVNQAEFFNVIDGDDNNGTLNQIEVIEGGSLRLTNTRVDRTPSGDTRDLTQLVVRDGGRFTMTDSFFGLEELQLLGDQTTVLRNDINSEVTVHGGTLLDFELNDLSDLTSANDGLIAIGDPGATLDFRRNYWGTTISAEIEDKILHQVDEATRPLVVYEPFLLQPNPIPDYAPIGLTIDTTPAIAGSLLDVTYNIRNLSLAGDANLQTAAVFFLVAGGANPGTKILDFVAVEPLDAGTETGPRSFSLELPDESDAIWANGLPGNYSIRILVDATDSLPEFNETNNSRVAGFTASPTVAIVNETGDGTDVSEDGATDTFSVVLSKVPQSNVKVRATPDSQIDLGAGPGNAVDLDFTPATALDPVAVTVSALDDSIIEGAHTGSVQFELSSDDSAFDGATLPSLPVTVVDNDSVRVLEFNVNEGDQQRSMIFELDVVFNTDVEFANNAIELRNLTTDELIDISVASKEFVDGKTTARLAFDPTDVTDGNYELTLRSSGVDAEGIPLDGDADGVAGSDYVDRFFRLLGDQDGDRDVDGPDYGTFGLAFLSTVGDAAYDRIFDFDLDGDVDGVNYGQFGSNLFASLDP